MKTLTYTMKDLIDSEDGLTNNLKVVEYLSSVPLLEVTAYFLGADQLDMDTLICCFRPASTKDIKMLYSKRAFTNHFPDADPLRAGMVIMLAYSVLSERKLQKKIKELRKSSGQGDIFK